MGSEGRTRARTHAHVHAHAYAFAYTDAGAYAHYVAGTKAIPTTVPGAQGVVLLVPISGFPP